MSAINNLTTDSTLTSLLQNLAGRSQEAAGAGGPNQTQRAEFQTQFEQAAEAAGVDTEALSSLSEQIQAAIASAIESAQQSGDTTDLRQIVTDAVETVLKENGIDPEDLEARLKAAMQDSMGEQEGPPPPPMGNMGPMGGPPPIDGGNSDSESMNMLSAANQSILDDDDSEQTDTSETRLLSFLQSLISSDQGDALKTVTSILIGLDVNA